MRLALGAAVVLAWGVLPHGAPSAQQPVVVGGSGQSSVVVNPGALGGLGATGAGRPAGGLRLPPGQLPDAQLLVPPSSQAALTPPAAQPPSPEPAPAAPEPPELEPPPAPEPPAAESEPTVAIPEPAVTVPEPSTGEAEMPSTPEPAPSVTVEPAPQPEVAAVSPSEPAAPAGAADMVRIPYQGDAADLPAAAESELAAVANRLLENDDLRAQVKAYAGGSSGSASAARRLSLSRALGVRAFLIEQGVRSTRIDVRALGNRSEGGPTERVDVVLVNR